MAQPGNDRDADRPPPLPDGIVRADRVGVSLRQAYDAVAAEALPDAFEDLLRQLEQGIGD